MYTDTKYVGGRRALNAHLQRQHTIYTARGMASNTAPPAYESGGAHAPARVVGGGDGPDGLDAEHQKWLLVATHSVADAESKLREVFLLVGGDAGVRVAQIKANPAAFTDDQSPVGKALAEALLELAKTESKIASERQARKE